MRAKFTARSNSEVTLEYDDIFSGDRVTETFTAPSSGGYVRRGDKQVCDKLSSRGSTLHLSNPDKYPLIDLIRREYKSMRKADLKRFNEF